MAVPDLTHLVVGCWPGPCHHHCVRCTGSTPVLCQSYARAQGSTQAVRPGNNHRSLVIAVVRGSSRSNGALWQGLQHWTSVETRVRLARHLLELKKGLMQLMLLRSRVGMLLWLSLEWQTCRHPAIFQWWILLQDSCHATLKCR